MLRAVWHGIVIAETPRTVRIEGNHYFPPESVDKKYFVASKSRTLCPWKGVANYYDLKSGQRTSSNGAWYYPHPSPIARRIKNHIAFYDEVRIDGEREPGPENGNGLRGALSKLFGRNEAP
ncbi:DUF427 domain-containing protein [Amycolatopsis palatopharyngis]|uniref:DUF427 domain-containing protein n=1 Tax=Amycolatopsis palatopharyngis TaxID=187982 RepID=UPI000E24A116|nr:DUF427 domain-containing protein [Amycolatopsis palatopharyngis]